MIHKTNQPTKIIVFILLLLSKLSCIQPEDVPSEFKRVDSTWKKIEHALEVDTIGYRAITAYLFFARNYEEREANWLIDQMKSHPNWEKNEDLESAAQLYRGWRYLEKSKDSTALQLFHNIKSKQIDILLSGIQASAFYFYLNNQLDTARKLYLKSYEIAESFGNKPWILRSANNIGTLYFDIREYDKASNYFTTALITAQEIKAEVPMLINNIITCALVDSDGQDAIQLYKKYSGTFKPNNPYEKTIYDLNKVHYFWKVQQLDSFKHYLDSVEVGNIGEVANNMRDHQYLFYFAQTQNSKSFDTLFSKYRNIILEDPFTNLPQWSDVLCYAQTKGMTTLTYSQLKKIHNQYKDTSNKKFQSTLSNLLYLHSSDELSKKKWLIEHLQYELDIVKSSAVSFQNDLKNQIKIHDLKSENNEIKLKLELESAENKTYLTMALGSTLVLILSVFGFVLFQKNKKITIQKLQLEIQNSRNIDEINTTKKQFAERLISANKTINKRLDKLSSKLKNSEFSKNPEILQVRKELDSITQLKGEWNSELQQIESIEDIRYLHEHFQCIQNFNQTEQSLLALIVKGHKVKEIATLMNISEQHVRNTKTKVLKSMSREKGFVVTIDFIGKIQNNGPINL